ncbi:MAG: hypothetical protein DMG14_26880 [Acidobacteria bacterium]|nr:MAG: hypothetical protein DMG14_26880 [Acidobacteriota bacterium]
MGATLAARSPSGELVKEKSNIRYIDFRSAKDGGRIFDFCISTTQHPDVLTSVEVPTDLLTGADRIRLQEGAGISYAKLKDLVEIGPLTEVPINLCLTASDVARYRQLPPTAPKRRSGFDASNSNSTENKGRNGS